MDQTQVISTGVGLAFVALLCLVSVNNAWRRRRAFERELAAMRAGQYPPLVAYQRYAQVNTRGASVALRLIVLIVALVMGYTIYTAITTPDNLGGIGALEVEDQYLFFLLLPLALFLPALVTLLLTAAWADAPAFAQLRSLPTRPADLVALRFKSYTANVLPLALIMELAAVGYALGVSSWLCVIGAVVAVFLDFAIITRLGPVLGRWYYPSKPIEQTPWAEWGERARAWSRLAGVPIRTVYVRSTAAYGVADGVTAGARPQALFLTDVFLNNSDWRQRDALICLLLAVSDRNRRRAQQRKRRGQAGQPGQPGQSAQRDGTIRVNGPAWLFLLVVIVGAALLATFGPQIMQNLPFPIDPILVLNVLPIALLVLILVLIFRSTRRARRQGPPANNVYFESDAVAAALCGDPLALMAAILGVNLLSGIVLDRRHVATLPSALDRVRAIEQAMFQPGSYAPWAAQPIPALTPVQLGPYIMSLPLSPQVIGERPGPVPMQPYPVTLSPWAATPMAGAAYGAPAQTPPNVYDSSQFPQPAAYPPPPEVYQPTPYAPPAPPAPSAPPAPPMQPPTGPQG